MIDSNYKSSTNMVTVPSSKEGIGIINDGINKISNETTSSPSNLNSSIKEKTSSTSSSTYDQIKLRSLTDRRVALNVVPIGYEESESNTQRILYLLGHPDTTINDESSSLQGLLYFQLFKTKGLIFPYTPEITISHSVNYETTDITHSNISINHYKNTPPPTYSLNAQFTADTRENARHMLTAIWFLRAMTKSDFGERANLRNKAGMPPPVLYLNGYDHMLDNVPVVISGFSYSLPKDKDYVLLNTNLSSTSESDAYSYFKTGSEQSTNTSGQGDIKYLQNQPIRVQNSSSSGGGVVYKNTYMLSNWLPTELNISLELKVQPNLLKTKKVFDLNDYKRGILNLEVNKMGATIVIPQQNGQKVETTKIATEQATGNTPKKYNFDKSGWTW